MDIAVVSKVVERIFLDRLSEYLDAMGNQFGFEPQLGTDMCIYSLKEIIGSHSQLNGCVFSCFWMFPKLLVGSNTLFKTRRPRIYRRPKIAHVLVCASNNVC